MAMEVSAGVSGAGYAVRSKMTPEPIFWTPNPAAQLGPDEAGPRGSSFGTPVASAPLPSAMRTLEPPGSAAALQAQHHALSGLLASLQASTQKGSNRCLLHSLPAVPCLADNELQMTAALDIWWQALSNPLSAFLSGANLCGGSHKFANVHTTRKKGTEVDKSCRIGRIEGILRVIGADAADPERVQRAEVAVANLMQQLTELQKSEGPLSEQARHLVSPHNFRLGKGDNVAPIMDKAACRGLPVPLHWPNRHKI